MVKNQNKEDLRGNTLLTKLWFLNADMKQIVAATHYCRTTGQINGQLNSLHSCAGEMQVGQVLGRLNGLQGVWKEVQRLLVSTETSSTIFLYLPSQPRSEQPRQKKPSSQRAPIRNFSIFTHRGCILELLGNYILLANTILLLFKCWQNKSGKHVGKHSFTEQVVHS